MTKKIKIDAGRCKSCGICVEHCPRNALAISKTAGKSGYAPVEVDDEKCIGCGMCYIMCPDTVFEILE